MVGVSLQVVVAAADLRLPASKAETRDLATRAVHLAHTAASMTCSATAMATAVAMVPQDPSPADPGATLATLRLALITSSRVAAASVPSSRAR